MQGAFMKTYLLEKSRITQQLSGEQNYHVLYQARAPGLCTGLVAARGVKGGGGSGGRSVCVWGGGLGGRSRNAQAGCPVARRWPRASRTR